MKAVILAGGMGTRISEETHLKPKPMVEIGGKPILWHIMKIFTAHGITEFVICLGYKGYMIKEYFANYYIHTSDLTIDMATNDISYHQNYAEPWKITLVDTGENTMTGGRLKRVRDYLGDGDFCFTYGDGVSDVDITGLVGFHKKHGKPATVTAIQPPGRYGVMKLDGESVADFREKAEEDGGWINGGFFVLSPKVIDMVDGDATHWERGPMEQLAGEGSLIAYKHRGFWSAMDTLRDKNHLEELWNGGKAPWKIWK
ncbi:MAG: glucose-1-phosphate cytidylyltransferase [Nitrospinae bacterium]|nr:glucose-1-phosphate cytidylyltransferase [Nitrospinota bacterium]